MNGRGWWVLLSWMLVMAAHAQPPAVHQVGDHWSAWDPPQTFPESTEVYIIEPGDTLWDLAQRFLGDPYRWPQLWEENQYILDAQWIYPGDPLVVPVTVAAESEGIAGPSITEEPEAGAPSLLDPFRAEPPSPVDASRFSTPPLPTSETPVPLGYESDIYCSGFIGDLEEDFPYRIAGSEYEFIHPSLDTYSRGNLVEGVFGKSDTVKYGLGTGDIVYIEGGYADGLSAGAVLMASEPQRKVYHPRTQELVGRLYRHVARVRVLSVQEETGIGEIIAACNSVPVGSLLRSFEPEPVPLRRLTPMRPVNFPAAAEEVAAGATIVAARDRIVALGTGHLIFIDYGVEEDVAPGDVFTVYRQGRQGFPPIVLGEAAVLSVADKGSLARIIRSRYTIYVGDSMVLK